MVIATIALVIIAISAALVNTSDLFLNKKVEQREEIVAQVDKLYSYDASGDERRSMDDVESLIDKTLESIPNTWSTRFNDRIPVISGGVPPSAKTMPARLSFNRPEFLELWKSTLFQLAVSVDPLQPAETEIDPRAPGQRPAYEIRAYATMSAELRGAERDFRVEPAGHKVRRIGPEWTRIMVWTWHVEPLRPGKDKPMTIELLGYPWGISHNEPAAYVKTFVETFEVDVGLIDLVIYTAQQATPLQLFGGAAAVALLTGSWVVFVFVSQRRKASLATAQTKKRRRRR